MASSRGNLRRPLEPMPTVPPPSRDATADPAVFWFRYKTELLAALLVIVLGAAGFAGYRIYSDRQESTAAELLGKARTDSEYRQVIDRYPGTPASASAYFSWQNRFGQEKTSNKPTQRCRRFSINSPSTNWLGQRDWGWLRISNPWENRLKRSLPCSDWPRVTRKVSSLHSRCFSKCTC